MKDLCNFFFSSNKSYFPSLIFSAEGNEQESSVPNDTMLELGARSKPDQKIGATYVVDESIALASNSSLGTYDFKRRIFLKRRNSCYVELIKTLLYRYLLIFI